MSNRQVLLLIAVFLTLTVGSFIWYIATWDSREVSVQAPLFIKAQTLLPEAPTLAKGLMT